MKANELRIGNLVNDEETTHIVVGVDNYYVKSYWHKDIKEETLYETPISQIKPIILTEEWLIKFGFERNNLDENNTWLNLKYRYLNFSSDESVNFNKVYLSLNKMDITCKYVHQLQNLYFALTGEEL